MRGTRSLRTHRCREKRFIPACAGNTSAWYGPAAPRPVHPRLCGEHSFTPGHETKSAGSSPPVRGTLRPANLGRPPVRFIPACAGNTLPSVAQRCCYPVHPRLCGEHVLGCVMEIADTGSSPPVRGTQCNGGPARIHHRFIPACAGNTPTLSAVLTPLAVHPRLCGEHISQIYAKVISVGSSPPVRGTLWQVLRQSAFPRFIPACAGNTEIQRCISANPAVHPRLCGEHGLPYRQ